PPRPAAGHGLLVSAHHARPVDCRVSVRQGRGHVPGPNRRARYRRGALRIAHAPVHTGAALGRRRPRPGAAAPADAHRPLRRASEPDRAAVRLRLPNPLPARGPIRARVGRAGAGAPRRRRRPPSRVSPGRSRRRGAAAAGGSRHVIFTTRPELRGTFGMVASTHWLASAAGMALLEDGGNAFDAAVAAGLVLQVVEPHLNGPGGDLPAIFWSAQRCEPLVLCAQGPAPAAATIDEYGRRGLDLVPGTGLLAACVPGAFDGWMVLLRDFGTRRLGEVAAFAIGYAEDGYPVAPRFAERVRSVETLLREWPASAALYLPPPEPGRLFRNRDLAATYRRIVADARRGSRRGEIERGPDAGYRRFGDAARPPPP